MINRPNFVYLLVDPGFYPPPFKISVSIAVSSTHRMDAFDRHNGQKDKRTDERTKRRVSSPVRLLDGVLTHTV